MSNPISDERASRIEHKIDELTAAVNRLAIIEERQIEGGKRMSFLEERTQRIGSQLQTLEKKVDLWVNRGIGVWAVVVTLYSVYQTFGKVLHS